MTPNGRVALIMIALSVGLAVLGGCGSAAITPPMVPAATATPTPTPTPTPSPTETPQPTPTWSASAKVQICRAIADLVDADKVAAKIRADANSQQWSTAYSASAVLLSDASDALDQTPLGFGALSRPLAFNDSVEFLHSYAQWYQAEGVDLRTNIDIGNYDGAWLAAQGPILPFVGGTLKDHTDALEAQFGPC
jgi:hypothetical protein